MRRVGIMGVIIRGQCSLRSTAIAAHRQSPGLAEIKGIRCLPQIAESARNHAYFPILVGPEYPISRDDLYALLKSRDIHGRRYFYPLISDFPMYRGMPSAQRSNLPVASDASARVLCLPIYPALGNFDVQRVIDVIRTARA